MKIRWQSQAERREPALGEMEGGGDYREPGSVCVSRVRNVETQPLFAPAGRAGRRCYPSEGFQKFSQLPISAFTLVEVMVAIALFFMATFAILDLVSQSLRMAGNLNQMGPTAGMRAAALSLTNKLEEGTLSGDWEDLYPGLDEYTWQADVFPYLTNGMFQVDITVFKKSVEDSRLSILLFRPESENIR